MILTAMRRYDSKDLSRKVNCTDIDFEVDLNLCNTFYEHSQCAFKLLTAKNQEDWFSQLPMEFTRGKAVKVGVSTGVGERTIDRRLDKFVKTGVLSWKRGGHYKKLP